MDPSGTVSESWSTAVTASKVLVILLISTANTLRMLAQTSSNLVNVGGFEHRLRPALFRDLAHGAADLFGGRHVFWETRLQQRQQRPKQHVEDSVEFGLRLNAVKRHDRSRTKYVGGPERQAQQFVLGLALDSRPHAAAALRAVGAHPGYIDE